MHRRGPRTVEATVELIGAIASTRDDDLAAKRPEKLAELQALFMAEAQKYHALPLDDRSIERLNPELAGRPDLMAGRTKLTLGEGMHGLAENVFVNVKNRSVTITRSYLTGPRR